MEITEVRIFLREEGNRKLRAYATVTFDNTFVVRNIKVIEGSKGLFVAMPSRRVKEPCPKCGHRNVLRSKFCNQCGSGLPLRERPFPDKGEVEDELETRERQAEHKDIAHPINQEFREYLQKRVLEAYQTEKSEGGTRASRDASDKELPGGESGIHTSLWS